MDKTIDKGMCTGKIAGSIGIFYIQSHQQFLNVHYWQGHMTWHKLYFFKDNAAAIDGCLTRILFEFLKAYHLLSHDRLGHGPDVLDFRYVIL